MSMDDLVAMAKESGFAAGYATGSVVPKAKAQWLADGLEAGDSAAMSDPLMVSPLDTDLIGVELLWNAVVETGLDRDGEWPKEVIEAYEESYGIGVCNGLDVPLAA